MAVIEKHPLHHSPAIMCSFCGEAPAVAYWAGMERETGVCRKCAVTVLPCLVADAIVQDHAYPATRVNVERALTEMEKSFWRACFFSALRAG